MGLNVRTESGQQVSLTKLGQISRAKEKSALEQQELKDTSQEFSDYLDRPSGIKLEDILVAKPKNTTKAFSESVSNLAQLPDMDEAQAESFVNGLIQHVGEDHDSMLNSLAELAKDFRLFNEDSVDYKARASKFLSALENVALQCQDKTVDSFDAIKKNLASFEFDSELKLNYDSLIELTFSVGEYLPDVINILSSFLDSEISDSTFKEYVTDIISWDPDNKELTKESISMMPDYVSEYKSRTILYKHMESQLKESGFSDEQISKLKVAVELEITPDSQKELFELGFSLNQVDSYQKFYDAIYQGTNHNFLDDQDYRFAIVSALTKNAADNVQAHHDQMAMKEYEESQVSDEQLHEEQIAIQDGLETLESMFQNLHSLKPIESDLDALTDELSNSGFESFDTGYDGEFKITEDFEINIDDSSSIEPDAI